MNATASSPDDLTPDEVLDLARHGETHALMAALDAGHSLESATDHGTTLLMLAAFYGNAQLVAALVARGAKLDVVDSHGQTALSGAIFKGEQRVARFLLACGANPELGRPSARETARQCGQERVFQPDPELDAELRSELGHAFH
ncbi:ankyrin repeat domain-containing protein [Raineyella fluvialis]|uniref:Ankyrin repeat domain-containing protein n=1 Tax=Raineyella fluvialis TaxID=2662261 RepID=A0A5Q2FGG4_9ACTN|nr:ankyrin repeat domain-containing protein [Raineyella fluvialis]QGF23396.1 ankyrin repeat domain-containing protein [Raineyella fluvialis]